MLPELLPHTSLVAINCCFVLLPQNVILAILKAAQEMINVNGCIEIILTFLQGGHCLRGQPVLPQVGHMTVGGLIFTVAIGS